MKIKSINNLILCYNELNYNREHRPLTGDRCCNFMSDTLNMQMKDRNKTLSIKPDPKATVQP